MERKENRPVFSAPPRVMSNYEWQIRFNRYAHLHREFNTEGSFLLDIVRPPKRQGQEKGNSQEGPDQQS